MNQILDEIYKSKYTFEQLIKAISSPTEMIKNEIKKSIDLESEKRQNLISLFTPESYEEWKKRQSNLTKLVNEDYLKIKIDKYGFFIIDDIKLKELHSKESIDGKLLKLLFINQGNIVPWMEIKKATEPHNIDVIRKNLKRRLKNNMFYIKYEIVKGSGIIFFGLSYEK